MLNGPKNKNLIDWDQEIRNGGYAMDPSRPSIGLRRRLRMFSFQEGYKAF